MKRINLALIGAGNVMQSRHLPALIHDSQRFNIIGIVDRTKEKCESVARKFKIPYWAETQDPSSIDWMDEIEAVIIATPPMQHADLINSSLKLGKHVLVEKPFVIDIEYGESLINYASQHQLVLAVNHNFQFSKSFSKSWRLLIGNNFGKLKSFYCIQFSSDTRRLPLWADDLPLGLFYDESPHAFYLLKRFGGGGIKIEDVSYVPSTCGKATPHLLNISIDANGIPAMIYSNFVSPINEWVFVIIGTKRIALINMFLDIITVLPNDGKHLMKDVFTSSVLATIQHWSGFISSGFDCVRNRLHYGMDVTHANFHKAITTGNLNVLTNMKGEDGLAVNLAQHEVIDFVNRKHR